MKFFLILIVSVGFSFCAFCNTEWIYYKQYPWVYDNRTMDWLYLQAGMDGKIYVYRQSSGSWGDFEKEVNLSDLEVFDFLLRKNGFKEAEISAIFSGVLAFNVSQSMGVNGLRKILVAGGSQSNFEYVLKAIGTGSVYYTHVIAAVDAGLTGGGDGANLHFLKAAGHIKTGKLRLDELTDLKNAIDAKVDIDKIFDDGGHGGIKAVKKLVDFGFTADHLEHLDASQLTSFVDAGTLLSVDNAQAAKGHLADGKLSLTKLIEHGVENVTKAVANNYTLDDLNRKSASDLTTTLGHIDAGLSIEQADAAHISGVSANTIQSLLAAGIPSNLLSSVAPLYLSDADLTRLSSNLAKGVSLETNMNKGISLVFSELASGFSVSEIESLEVAK